MVFLGGLGEIGRNCMVIEMNGRRLMVDCGLLFPDPGMPGVDLVLPDFSYVTEEPDLLDGCVLTHGHEDHVGALSYLLTELDRSEPLAIWGPSLALGIARSRLEEAGVMDLARLVPMEDGARVEIGSFDVEAIPVTHSVPDSNALMIRTPQGVIFHTGDFKLDPLPVDGRLTDLARIGEISGTEGIRLMLSDSTNADEPGYTESESTMLERLRQLFDQYRDRRVIVTCFSSHIHRIQQVIDAARSHGRFVAALGRSMTRNISLASQLGLLRLPEAGLVDIDAIEELDPSKLCVISTGSQGEPMSALSQIASGGNKRLQLGPRDLVVLSSHPIPGNEWAVGALIDALYRRGAEVVYWSKAVVHVSGHAKRDELRTMLGVALPDWFVPIHGEYRHLVNHRQLAQEAFVEPERALLCLDGDVLVLDDQGVRVEASVPAGFRYVDGAMGDLAHGVLRDRRVLASEGVLVVVVGVDERTGEVVSGPEIVTKGWADEEEAADLVASLRKGVTEALEQATRGGARETEALAGIVRQEAGRLLARATRAAGSRAGRSRPMILPVVVAL